MTWPIVALAFWSPGDARTDAVDRLLADPLTPLAKHGLTGIAGAYARETGAVLHDVHREWEANLTGRSLGVDGALAEVAARFDAAGIDHFVAKGPTIAHTLYADAGLRPYCDLDVYVAPGQHAEARALLTAAGYEPVHHATGALGGLAQELHGGTYGATVELHAHVIDNLHRHHLPPVAAFLTHVVRVELAGVSTRVLAPGAHLALQAIHAAAGHRYAKLMLLRDVELALAAGAHAPAQLGAAPYLAVLTALLDALGRPVVPAPATGTLLRPLVAAMLRTDPRLWDEYRLSTANVLALLHQQGWGTAVTSGARAVASAVPRRERRVATRAPRRVGEPHPVLDHAAVTAAPVDR